MRDNKVIQELKRLGWSPKVIWECELKSENRNTTLENILLTISEKVKI
jgi:G:T-mismatch repair DNA endonuclease (very short patch repair protein)